MLRASDGILYERQKIEIISDIYIKNKNKIIYSHQSMRNVMCNAIPNR